MSDKNAIFSFVMSYFQDKVVWVTGASSGIGEALVYELVKSGALVIISARREEELLRVAKNAQKNNQINILPLDLENYNSFEEITQKALTWKGKIDILINNGGISQRSLAEETKIQVDEKLMKVNYLGTVALTKSLLTHWIQKKYGHVVTISSVTGHVGTPYRSGYAASKHALHGFFDSLRAEVADRNIFVTMICPGFIQTQVSVNALTGDGSTLNQMDEAQAKGMPADVCAKKILKAIQSKKREASMGGFKEILALYLKRFFPGILANIMKKAKVR